MKFRHKPTVVEAKQWWPRSHPNRLGTIRGVIEGDHGETGWIKTFGGLLEASPGDWIVSEGDGEHFYPCKPEIFDASYEAVTE